MSTFVIERRRQNTYSLRGEVQIAERVEFVTNVVPELVDLFVVLVQLGISGIDGLFARSCRLIFVFVDLCE